MRKTTDRQKIHEWIIENPILEDTEETLSEIFGIAMECKEYLPELYLEQAYSYAVIKYVNNHSSVTLTKDWEKLGYTDEQAKELEILSNISDDFSDIEYNGVDKMLQETMRKYERENESGI